ARRLRLLRHATSYPLLLPVRPPLLNRPADDGGCAGFGALGQNFNDRVSSPRKCWHFSNAQRAVEDNRLRAFESLTEGSDRFGTNVHNTPSLGNLADGDNRVVCIWSKAISNDYVGRQQKLQTTLMSLADQFTGDID